MLNSRFMIYIFQARYTPDLCDLYDPASVAGWESNNLHNLAHVSWLDLYYTDNAEHLMTAG